MESTKISQGFIVAPVPVQLMFGGCPVDPEFVDDVYAPEPRWDIATIDEALAARCASL